MLSCPVEDVGAEGPKEGTWMAGRQGKLFSRLADLETCNASFPAASSYYISRFRYSATEYYWLAQRDVHGSCDCALCMCVCATHPAQRARKASPHLPIPGVLFFPTTFTSAASTLAYSVPVVCNPRLAHLEC